MFQVVGKIYLASSEREITGFANDVGDVD